MHETCNSDRFGALLRREYAIYEFDTVVLKYDMCQEIQSARIKDDLEIEQNDILVRITKMKIGIQTHADPEREAR